MSDPNRAALDDPSAFTVEGAAGDFVYRDGDPSSEMYVVLEGEIEILDSITGTERRLARLASGDFFGEELFLADASRATAARGLTDFKLLRIEATVLDRMVDELPAIAIHIVRGLSFRIKEAREREIEALRTREEPAEVAPPRLPAEARPPILLRAFLVHEESGTEFPLSSAGITQVGRPDYSSGFTPAVDLADWDSKRSLSRRHARIVSEADGYYLEPEPTAPNGTFISGERIPADDRVKLEDGCEVRFGLVETVFRLRVHEDF